MIRYGQYCPIAKALELLGERWTLLVVRELLMGSGRFNDLQRGVPLMYPPGQAVRFPRSNSLLIERDKVVLADALQHQEGS